MVSRNAIAPGAINKPIDKVSATKKLLDQLDEWMEKENVPLLPFTPQWEESNHENSLGAQQTLGQGFVFKKIYLNLY